jgi:uncharacterized OsmC-like protein
MRKVKHTRKRKTDRPTKFIRINDKTLIEVDVDTPNDEAIENYLVKAKEYAPVNKNNDIDEFVRGINFFK